MDTDQKLDDAVVAAAAVRAAASGVRTLARTVSGRAIAVQKSNGQGVLALAGKGVLVVAAAGAAVAAAAATAFLIWRRRQPHTDR